MIGQVKTVQKTEARKPDPFLPAERVNVTTIIGEANVLRD